MSRILFVNHFLRLPGEFAGSRTMSIAIELAKKGHEVECIGCSWEHKSKRQRLGLVQLYGNATHCGVKLKWIKSSTYSSMIMRLINHLQFTVGLLLFAVPNFARSECVVASNVHPFAAMASFALSVLTRTRYYYEVRDIWPMSLAHFGTLRKQSLTYQALEKIDIFLASRAAGVISNLHSLPDYYKGKGLDLGEFLYLSNGFDASNDVTRHRQPASIDPAAAISFVYAGALNESNAIDKLVDFYRHVSHAAKALDLPPPKLVVFGDGKKARWLREHLDTAIKDKLVDLRGPTRKEVLQRELPANPVYLVPCFDDYELYRFGISFNKLFDPIQLRLPSVFLGSPDYLDPRLRQFFITIEHLSDSSVKIALGKLLDNTPQNDDVESIDFGDLQRRYSYGYLAGRLASFLSESKSDRTEN